MKSEMHKMIFLNTDNTDYIHLPAYIDGETSFSYLERLAIANAFPNQASFFECLHDENRHMMTSADCGNNRFINTIAFADDTDSWFATSSIYKELSPFMASHYVNKKINAISYSDNQYPKLTGRPSYYLSNVKICPECFSEDMASGNPYLHKFHQIPGICFCPKHECRLLERPSNHTSYDYPLFDLNEYDEITDRGCSLEDTIFLKRIIDSHIEGNLESTIQLIRQRLIEHYGEETVMYDFDFTLSEDPRFSDVKNSLPIIKKILFNQYCPTCNLSAFIPFIRRLYDDTVEVFIKDLETIKLPYTEKQLKESIPEGYKLTSKYSNVVIELMNSKTGLRFVVTPQTLIDKWPMPDAPVKDEDSVIMDLVERKVGSKWLIMTPIKSPATKIEIKDSDTGNIYITTFERLITYGDTGTIKPNKQKRIAELTQKMDGIYGYTIIDIKGGKQNPQILIHHSLCGQKFWVTTEEFLKFPYCHSCKYESDEAEQKICKEISAITNNNFKWKGNIKKDIFKAICYKGTHKEISANNCNELLMKLKSDKDGSKQEANIVMAIERIIFMEMDTHNKKIHYVKDFLKYGKKSHLKIAIDNLTRNHAILKINDEILVHPKSGLTKDDIIDQFFIDHSGVPLGDTLLRHAGIETSPHRKVYLQFKSNKKGWTSESLQITNEIVTTIYSPMQVTKTNRYILALLVSLEHETLSKNWTQDSKAHIAMWISSRNKNTRWSKYQKYFSQSTITIAQELIEKKNE